jgi:hypothetical protein
MYTFSCLNLVSSIWYNVSESHLCCLYSNLFLFFFCRVIFHCRDICHNLFTHSPVNGYVNYFQFGAIVNKIAINI